MRKHTISALVAALSLAVASPGLAAGGEAHTEDVAFSFEGPFGTYDDVQLQRGLKVYTEICAGCHGLKYVAFRELEGKLGVGFTADEVRAYAAQWDIYDPELDDTRPGKPTDHFPANTDAGAPDLSMMAKARAGFHGPYGTGLAQLFKGMGGPEYIYSILTGYTGEEKEEAGVTLYENKAFPGGWISMAPPLFGEDVEFDDGHDNSLHHEAMDVAAFLMWAAEPKLEARKMWGLVGVVFLVFLTALLYLTNKQIWAPIKRAAKEGS